MPTDANRAALRATLANLDARQQKIVGGLLAVLIENPGRVRDSEWLAEQFTHVTLLASGFEDVDSAQDGVEQVRAYAQEHFRPLMTACIHLYVCVGEDMAARDGGFTREDAMARALEYFA